jgi:predicted porin
MRFIVPEHQQETKMNQHNCGFAGIGLVLGTAMSSALAQPSTVTIPSVSGPSSVTIHGLIDVGVNKGNGGTAANTQANGTSTAWIMKQASPSRLGFRGNENLGGGLSAQFVLEHRFTPDDGNALTPFWQGRSLVQLSSVQAGSIYMGREYFPAIWTALFTDPFVWAGVGQLGGSQLAGYLGTAGPRTDNTIGYRSPSFLGFRVNAAYSLGETVNGNDKGINFEYTQGPWYVSAGYDGISGGPAANAGNKLINAGLIYDFGFIRPMFYAARSKTGGGTRKNTFYSAGFRAPVGVGTVKAVYSHFDPFGADNTQQKYAVGYEYNFSKRSLIYVDLSRGREQNKTNNTAYSIGVRHSF